MTNWKAAVVLPEATIHEAIVCLDQAALQIVLVCDVQGRLLGTLTDGDVRRAILAGTSMTEPVTGIMQKEPVTTSTGASRETVVRLMQSRDVRRLPVLDSGSRVVGLELIERLVELGAHPNTVVLMVGGLGTRLRPKTETVPKPMLEVGGKPMLQRIVENFRGYGFRNFVMAVNYRGEMIEEFFGSGTRFGVQIEYVREDKRLGTAGALALLQSRPEAPFFVMNGDVLTECNFEMMLDFHAAEGAQLTMAVREYDFQVPFGVVNMADRAITSIDEKPVQSFFVNAGIYVLDPAVLAHIPADEATDMPAVVQRLIAAGASTRAFPLREAWIDVGRDEDYQRADSRYGGGADA